MILIEIMQVPLRSYDLMNMNSIMHSMREVEANGRMEGKWQPVELYHVAPGLRWTTLEVLDGWTHPGWPGRTYKKPVVDMRYRLRVFGPLPGRPDQLGELVMIVTAYGNRCRLWIRPTSRVS
jgi:hypothetical protein